MDFDKQFFPDASDEELQAITELLSMTPEELEQVDHERKKWCCHGKKCARGSFVKDYGILPFVYFRKRWVNLHETYLMCAKHWKIKKRIEPRFGRQAFEERFLDINVYPVNKLIPA